MDPAGPAVDKPFAHGIGTELADKVLAVETYIEPNDVEVGIRLCAGMRAQIAAGWGSPQAGGGTETELLLELRLPAVPASCARARHDVCVALHGLPVDVAAVELALSEAVTNAVVHAYRDRIGEGADDRFEVRVRLESEGVWVVVADDGVGMAARVDSPGLGLGLRLIRTLTDQLLIVQGEIGTRVHMGFRFLGDGRALP